jgi:hypothetical protein
VHLPDTTNEEKKMIDSSLCHVKKYSGKIAAGHNSLQTCRHSSAPRWLPSCQAVISLEQRVVTCPVINKMLKASLDQQKLTAGDSTPHQQRETDF